MSEPASSATVSRADLDRVQDAAELVSFALRPRIAQASNDRYSELWRDYRTDSRLRETVEAIADGLGLVVLDLTEQGLIVAPTSDSPFAFRLSDYASGMDPQKRMLTGLVHLGIAASCYPREEDLENDHVVRRSINDVEALLRTACSALEDAGTATPEAEDEARTAWQAFAATPSVRLDNRGRPKAACTLGMILRAFEWLVEQGMARDTGDGKTFQVLDRYRVQVRELAGHATLELLRASATASPPKPAARPES